MSLSVPQPTPPRVSPWWLASWLFIILAYSWLFLVDFKIDFTWELMWWTVMLFPVVPLLINRRITKALRINSIQCPSFHQGDRGYVKLTLENPNSLPVGDIELNVSADTIHCEVSESSVSEVRVPLPHWTRGQHPVPNLNLQSSFPFGVFCLTRTLPLNTDCTVYPTVEANAPPWPPECESSARPSHFGDDVVAFREHRPGDPLSSMDWKLSARQNKLIVRQFDTPISRSAQFSLDQVAQLDLEAALSRLTAWVLLANEQCLTYSLQLKGKSSGPGYEDAHLKHCLHMLALFPGSPA